MYPMNMGQQPIGQPTPLNPQGYIPNMPQGVPQAPNQGMYTTTQQMGFRVRPVGSYDEAKAVPTDFLGNMLVLTDLSHGKIYTKILDPSTGSPIFKSYSLDIDSGTETPNPETNTLVPPYDAKAEIESIRAELNSIKEELGIKEEEK